MSLLYPEATVGALIFNKEKKLFLMKSYKWKDQYCLPGGHIELGETAEEAIIREVKEETNLDVTNLTFHCVQDAVFSKAFHEKHHFIFIDFTCNAVSSDVILNDEASEYLWVNLDELNKYDIEKYTLNTIHLLKNPDSKKYFNNREFDKW